MDYQHYEYDSYTTGRKQDYGHHTLNKENGWQCFDWDRGDYTETMQMKRPLPGKGWKPFRVYYSGGIFEDFLDSDKAVEFFNNHTNLYPSSKAYVKLVTVDAALGKDLEIIMKSPPDPPKPTPPKLNFEEKEFRGFIAAIEEMLAKETEHTRFLEKSLASDVGNDYKEQLNSMIARSKHAIDHFTVRIEEYKAYAIEHYGK